MVWYGMVYGIWYVVWYVVSRERKTHVHAAHVLHASAVSHVHIAVVHVGVVHRWNRGFEECLRDQQGVIDL